MKCPNCGGELNPDMRFATLIVCEYCQTSIVNDQEALKVHGKMSILATAQSGVSLAARISIGDLSCTVLGRVRYGYAKGFWDEWFLLRDDGTPFWLSEDAGMLRLEQRIEGVKIPGGFDKLRVGKHLRIKKNSFRVVEKGTATCEGGEGQLPFMVEPGEEVPYADISGKDMSGSIEFDDENVVIYIGSEIPLRSLRFDAAGKGGQTLADEKAADDNNARRIVRNADRNAALNCFNCAAPLPQVQAGDKTITCASCNTITDLSMAQMQCTNCGVSIPVGNSETVASVYCPQCHTQHRINNGLPEALGRITDSTVPISKFSLGQACEFFGTQYRITGLLKYSQVSYGRTYNTLEYLLSDDEGRQRWLSLYNGHFTFIRPCSPPQESFRPKYLSAGEHVTCFDQKWQVGEGKITETLKWVSGELPWVAEIGDRTSSVEAARPPELFGVEFGEQEEEWYRGTYLEPEVVAKAFNMPLYKMPKRRGVVWQQPYKAPAYHRPLKRGSLLATALCFLFLLCTCGSGSQLMNQRFSTHSYDGAWQSQTFKVTEPGVCLFEFKSSCSNQWVWLGCALVNEEDETVVHEFSSQMSYYSGSEGGESWSEGSNHDSVVLYVDKVGTYSVMMETQQGHGSISTYAKPSVPVVMTVQQNVVLQRWFIMGLVLFFCLWAWPVYCSYSHNMKRKREAGLIDDEDD